MRAPHSYLVFDFETTGLIPHHDRIIQVGLCLVSGAEVTARNGWLVNQDTPIHPEATRVHGITTGDIKARGIPPRESLARLLEAMNSTPVCVGHNIHRFDVPFLLAESRRLGVPPPACANFIDTAAIFKGRELGMSKGPRESHEAYANRVLSIRTAGLKYSVEACMRALGIKADTTALHNASQDAYLTHLIFQALQEKS